MVNEEFINHYLIQNIWYRIMEYSVFSLNLWKPPWINQWLRTKDVFFLLYGDIRTVAENWQSQVLFVLDSYPKIYIVLIWDLVSVIQQKKKLKSIMRYTFEDRKKIMKTFLEASVFMFSSFSLLSLYYYVCYFLILCIVYVYFH